MPELKNLSEEQVMIAIHNGEFGPDVIQSDKHVAVIMTQNWCSQWAEMKNWIYAHADAPGLALYLLIYDASPHFKEFLEHKEQRWRNALIPYIRFYKNGKLAAETNYVPEDEFIKLLQS